jgi:hypothetical protein
VPASDLEKVETTGSAGDDVLLGGVTVCLDSRPRLRDQWCRYGQDSGHRSPRSPNRDRPGSRHACRAVAAPRIGFLDWSGAAHFAQQSLPCRSRGSIATAGQKIHLGIGHAGRTVTVEDAGATFRVYDGDQLLADVPRTTTKPIARFKVRMSFPRFPGRLDHSPVRWTCMSGGGDRSKFREDHSCLGRIRLRFVVKRWI